MRTNKERAELVQQRTAYIKEKRHKVKMGVMGITSLAASICLLIAGGNYMAEITSGFKSMNVESNLPTASLLAESESLGYVLMALLAFALGIFVTMLLYVVHRRNEMMKKESDSDE